MLRVNPIHLSDSPPRAQRLIALSYDSALRLPSHSAFRGVCLVRKKESLCSLLLNLIGR